MATKKTEEPIAQTPPDQVAIGQTPPDQATTTAAPEPEDERPYSIDDWAGHENFHCHVDGCRYDGYLGREAFEAHWQLEHVAPPAAQFSTTLTDELGRPIRLN